MDNSFIYETNTRYIDYKMQGSPNLNNSYGSLKDLLKITLTEGFNIQKPLKIEYDSDNNFLILFYDQKHGYLYNQVLSLTGSDESIFEGEFRVVESRTKTLKLAFNKKTSLDIVISTEGFTTKVAPLGYSVVFEDLTTNTICFQNASVKSSAILKVIDTIPPNGYGTTWNKYARVVVGQEIDSYGNFINNEKTPYWDAYPDVEETGNGVSGSSGIHGFAKWDYAIRNNSSDVSEIHTERGRYPTDWRIIGDDKTFYLMIRPGGQETYSYNVLGYGNFVSDSLEDTDNICLQARNGLVDASSNDGNNFSRTRNNFGVLDRPYGGFLFSNIFGNIKTENSNRYSCEGFYVGGSNANRPWKSTDLKSVNPVTGLWTTSKLYIKDSDNYLRGYHRGIRIFCGYQDITDNAASRSGDIVLRVQTPTEDSNFETMPLLFTLKDWEHIE